jgi:hypothetical protein
MIDILYSVFIKYLIIFNDIINGKKLYKRAYLGLETNLYQYKFN